MLFYKIPSLHYLRNDSFLTLLSLRSFFAQYLSYAPSVIPLFVFHYSHSLQFYYAQVFYYSIK